MTTDLATLTTAASRWDGMAKEFHKQEFAYKRDVYGISMGQTWTGLSADAANKRFAVTLKEFQNAQVEAEAVASLLRDAHTQFTDLRKKLESARADAVEAGMAVSDNGVVSYDTAKLSDGERTALHHDPDYQQSVRTAVASWQARIDQLVKDVGDADTGVEIALKAVVIDSDINDGTLTGFNGQAQGDIEKYEAAAAARDTRTKTDGWVADGETEASGPGVGTSATGPDTGTGKLGEAEAHADLGRASAEGSLTNGPMKLAGEAEAYAGAKGSAAGGITNEGIKGEAGAFAGAEATASGRADAGPVGVYARAETKAGAEAGVNAGAGLEGLQAGAEAFAGAKAGAAGGADIGGIGAGATVEGWAGIGAEAEATLGKGTDGKWHIGATTGVALGLGGEVGFEVTVDPGKIADTASDAADAVGDAAGAVGDAVGSLF
ncbi:hypothetical protein ABT009_12835 [Streptomyces sp. NPDC002896]|uniref:hypothetical protein n=1 Tax=Streptomyces sp. NPDC002896 TaxID=3154438 RepID=UPI0033272CED